MMSDDWWWLTVIASDCLLMNRSGWPGGIGPRSFFIRTDLAGGHCHRWFVVSNKPPQEKYDSVAIIIHGRMIGMESSFNNQSKTINQIKFQEMSLTLVSIHPAPSTTRIQVRQLGHPWGTLGHPDQYAQRAAAADQGWEANVQTNTRCLDLMEFYHGHGDKLLISIGLKTDHLEKGCRNRINFWNRVSQNQLGPWFLSLGLLETCFFFEFWNNWVCLKNEGCRFTP